jgi:acetaldehyde dehydrogenase (acetylating)
MGYRTAADGIQSLLAADRRFDIVFDASNAQSHLEHWESLEPLGTMLVNLTPRKLGHMVVPTVNGAEAVSQRDDLIELGRRQAAAGQEDLIVAVVLELRRCTRDGR